MMRLQLATKDYIGARTQQQDAAAVQSIGDDIGAILILADGLGGHEGGAVASRIVIDTFREAAQSGAFTSPDKRRLALRDALEEANTRIAGGVDPAHGHRGMASTAVVAVAAEGTVSWISVGDSHLYVWREGRLKKLNEDHSQAGLMVRSGQYKATDPEVLAAKSVLVSALTGRKLEIVDHPSKPFLLEKGDILLLASDGLNTLSEDEIEQIVGDGAGKDPTLLSNVLIDTVRDRRADRQDNTTVAVARVLHVPKRAGTEARTELSPPTHQITAPTEVPAAQQRTEFAPVPRAPEQPTKPQPAQSGAVTQRVDGEPPLTVPTTPIAAPVSAKPDARTEIPPPKRPEPQKRPQPELESTRPMAPIELKDPPSRSWMPFFGLGMLVLAALLGGLLIADMAGWRRPLDVLLGRTVTTPPELKSGPLPAPPRAPAQKDAQPPPQPAPQQKGTLPPSPSTVPLPPAKVDPAPRNGQPAGPPASTPSPGKSGRETQPTPGPRPAQPKAADPPAPPVPPAPSPPATKSEGPDAERALPPGDTPPTTPPQILNPQAPQAPADPPPTPAPGGPRTELPRGPDVTPQFPAAPRDPRAEIRERNKQFLEEQERLRREDAPRRQPEPQRRTQGTDGCRLEIFGRRPQNHGACMQLCGQGFGRGNPQIDSCLAVCDRACLP